MAYDMQTTPVNGFGHPLDLDVSLGVADLRAERDRIITYLENNPDASSTLGGHLARTLAYIRAAEAAEAA